MGQISNAEHVAASLYEALNKKNRWQRNGEQLDAVEEALLYLLEYAYTREEEVWEKIWVDREGFARQSARVLEEWALLTELRKAHWLGLWTLPPESPAAPHSIFRIVAKHAASVSGNLGYYAKRHPIPCLETGPSHEAPLDAPRQVMWLLSHGIRVSVIKPSGRDRLLRGRAWLDGLPETHAVTGLYFPWGIDIENALDATISIARHARIESLNFEKSRLQERHLRQIAKVRTCGTLCFGLSRIDARRADFLEHLRNMPKLSGVGSERRGTRASLQKLGIEVLG